MTNKTNLLKALGLGAVIVGLTAGAASAAVATASASVRDGPGLSFDRIDRLHPGEFVSVVDREGRWCEIEHRGPDGWVRCNLLANGRVDLYRYDPYRHFDNGPSVQFQFGFGTGMGMHKHPHSSTTVTNDGSFTIY